MELEDERSEDDGKRKTDADHMRTQEQKTQSWTENDTGLEIKREKET
jgi:hypothetical protein